MNRRGFLGFLGAAVAGATLDPERLLWQPGKKFISVPSIGYDEMEEMYLRPAARAFADAMDRDIVNWITRETLSILQNNLEIPRLVNARFDAAFRQPIGEIIQVRSPIFA